ncbi:MAG: hypothetical protein JO341_07085 [Gammaproteobacteria bacterium]|nr:hypothetical protein [Gammaproteobacteria bacterium]MBV9620775.1 hypothetical protein [Gammaproteobacteria bacterium]
MLLQCETEADPGDTGWLSAATLASLAELNEEGLELLAAQAELSAADLPLQQLAARWRTLEPAARRRAGACPYLLLDADFAAPERWDLRAHEPLHPFFTVAAARPLTQAIFAFAWHLSRCQPAAAALLLALAPAGTARLAACTWREARALAASQTGRLRPRWWQRPGFWRALLAAAAATEFQTLERVRAHGQILFAASLHRAPARAPAPLRRPAGVPAAQAPSAPSAA